MTQTRFQGAISGGVLAAQSFHGGPANWVFAAQTSGWDWLLQLRLDGSGAYTSTPVTAQFQQQGHCDATSCEGCPDLATNRLCQVPRPSP